MSPIEKDAPWGFSHIRKELITQTFSEESINIILSAWRTSTKKTYQTFIQKWFLFTKRQGIDPLRPSLANFITFLTSLYKSGLHYNTICIARSAINQFLLICTGKNFEHANLVQKLLKAVI